MNCRQPKPIAWRCECQMTPVRAYDKFPHAKIKKRPSVKPNITQNHGLKNKTSLRKYKESCSLKSNGSLGSLQRREEEMGSSIIHQLRFVRREHNATTTSPLIYRQTFRTQQLPNSIQNRPIRYQNHAHRQSFHPQPNTLYPQVQNIKNLSQKTCPLTPISKCKTIMGKENQQVQQESLQPFRTNNHSFVNDASRTVQRWQNKTQFQSINQGIIEKRPVSMTKIQIIPKGKTLQDFASTTELESVHGEDEESSEEFSEVIMGFRKIGDQTQQIQLNTHKDE